MGHSEAVHASRYLVEEQAEHKLAHLLQRRALDEGRRPQEASPVPVVREVTRRCNSLSSATPTQSTQPT